MATDTSLAKKFPVDESRVWVGEDTVKSHGKEHDYREDGGTGAIFAMDSIANEANQIKI